LRWPRSSCGKSRQAVERSFMKASQPPLVRSSSAFSRACACSNRVRKRGARQTVKYSSVSAMASSQPMDKHVQLEPIPSDAEKHLESAGYGAQSSAGDATTSPCGDAAMIDLAGGHIVVPERDDFSSNRHPALPYCWSMIFSENRSHFSGSCSRWKFGYRPCCGTPRGDSWSAA
jgi:hypothetical protein